MNLVPEFFVEPLPERIPPPERWLRVAPPIEGESLTSRLGRQARLWSVPLSSLLRDALAPDEKSAPDLDIAPPFDLVARIAARFGESPSEMEKGTFRQVLRHLMPPEYLARISTQRWKLSHIPWILPSGWQDGRGVTAWRGRGIPFCPVCVMEESVSHAPLAHRLAFHVACEKHHVLLLDKCPTCESRTSPAYVALHPDVKEGVNGIRCDHCPTMLPTRAPVIEKAGSRLLSLQSALSLGLINGSISVPQLGQFPTIQYLGGLRVAFSAVVWLRDQGVTLPPVRSGKVPPYSIRSSGMKGGPFETQPLQERVLRMRDAAWILAAPLDRWPLLYQLCAWPANFPRWLRHPWEGITEDGVEMRNPRRGATHSQPTGTRDVQKVRAFFDLVEELGIHPVRVQGMLGNISSSRYQRWRNQPATRFPLESYRRMEAFLRLWDGLLAFFNAQSIAHEWVNKPNRNPLFGGLAPIDAFSGPGTLNKFEASISMFGGAAQALNE